MLLIPPGVLWRSLDTRSGPVSRFKWKLTELSSATPRRLATSVNVIGRCSWKRTARIRWRKGLSKEARVYWIPRSLAPGGDLGRRAFPPIRRGRFALATIIELKKYSGI